MMKKLTFIFSLLMLFTFGGCKKAVIEGKIFDGFGKHVIDATVKIEGTQFISQTNSNGEYSVGYVPGEIKVLITKQGYTDTTFTLKISTEATYPAEATTIYEIPKENGIYLMQNGNYQPLSKAKVIQHTIKSENFWFNSQSTSYYVEYNNVLTIKKNAAPILFFDNDLNNQTLLTLLATEDGRNMILQRNVSNGGLGFAMGDYKDTAVIIKETYRIFKNGLALRSANLEVGDYIFATCTKSITEAIQGDCYVIRVIN